MKKFNIFSNDKFYNMKKIVFVCRGLWRGFRNLSKLIHESRGGSYPKTQNDNSYSAILHFAYVYVILNNNEGHFYNPLKIV